MWLTTFPGAHMPTEHPTEAAAEAHAAWLVTSRATEYATCFFLTVLPDEETQ